MEINALVVRRFTFNLSGIPQFLQVHSESTPLK